MFVLAGRRTLPAMTITRIQPDGLLELPGLSHVVVTTGRRLVHIAGQVPLTADGSLIGEGDMAEQSRVAFTGLVTCLAAAGATPADLVRLTIYVVGLDDDAVEQMYAGAHAVFGPDLPAPAATMIGVVRLFVPGQLIEIDGIAALD
jgi:enamine deaminase RidA (YjgF/YER057c/UK114 family)